MADRGKLQRSSFTALRISRGTCSICGWCTFTFPDVLGTLPRIRFDRWQIDVRGRLLGSIEELLEEGATPAAAGARSVAVTQL